jgi:hypothetical protein
VLRTWLDSRFRQEWNIADTLDTTTIVLPTTSRRGVVPQRCSGSEAPVHDQNIDVFALGFVIAGRCQWSLFHLSTVALNVSPFRIEASGRHRLRIHKN